MENKSHNKNSDGHITYNADSGRADMFKESAHKYYTDQKDSEVVIPGKVPGEYTLEDYYALPEEKRVELIDGVFYDMAAPSVVHQVLADELQSVFRTFIMKNKGKCLAVTSPVDVQVDKSNKTMVQPDVIILCDREKFRPNKIYGAPDLIVEVLSNSSRKRDWFIKKNKYRISGVKEYWVVNPYKKDVTVYRFEEGDGFKIYGITEPVPVGIFDSRCMVDFKEIYGIMDGWE